MSFLATLGKAAGSLLGGDAIKDIGNIVDDLHTSGEEKAEAKQKITQILAQAEQAAQAQVSARWEADLKHRTICLRIHKYTAFIKVRTLRRKRQDMLKALENVEQLCWDMEQRQDAKDKDKLIRLQNSKISDLEEQDRQIAELKNL